MVLHTNCFISCSHYEVPSKRPTGLSKRDVNPPFLNIFFKFLTTTWKKSKNVLGALPQEFTLKKRMILFTVVWTFYFMTSGNCTTCIKMWKVFDMASNQCCRLMTFCSDLDIISIYFLEIIKFIQKCWRSCNAWEQEYSFSIFWKFLKSEFQAIKMQVLHTPRHFSPILLRKRFYSLKSDSSRTYTISFP